MKKNTHSLASRGARISLALMLSLGTLPAAALAEPASFSVAAAASVSAPKNVSVKAYSTKVTLSWSKVSGADAYRVYIKGKNGKWTACKTVKTNSCTVTGLDSNTAYSFKVYSLIKKGKSYTEQKCSSAIDVVTLIADVPSSDFTGLFKSDGKVYYAKKGTITSGLVKYNNSWYYFDEETCQMKTGWVSIDGTSYYFLENGKAATGNRTINGKGYNFNSDGSVNVTVGKGNEKNSSSYKPAYNNEKKTEEKGELNKEEEEFLEAFKDYTKTSSEYMSLLSYFKNEELTTGREYDYTSIKLIGKITRVDNLVLGEGAYGIFTQNPEGYIVTIHINDTHKMGYEYKFFLVTSKNKGEYVEWYYTDGSVMYRTGFNPFNTAHGDGLAAFNKNWSKTNISLDKVNKEIYDYIYKLFK